MGVACGLAATACLAASACQAAPDLHPFNIPPQPLDTAIAAFEAASHAQVLYDPNLVRVRQAPALQGTFSDLDALNRLLQGSHLAARTTAQGVMLIVPDDAPPAAEPAPAPQPAPVGPPTVVVITGYRASVEDALRLKRHASGVLDAIVAEDMAKFPDSNLAEALQRLPSVTLIIGDGGEGRNITVRGLGPMFSRVRVDGMAAASLTGASDKFGPTNNARTFDFNVFASDIFSALLVSKSASSDQEEGSLGATVDLKVPKPFDFHGTSAFSLTARAAYNTFSGKTDPHLNMEYVRKSRSGRFGILASLAYQVDSTREVGYSAADVLSAGMSGNGLGSGAAVQPFCTPIGYPVTSPSPIDQADKGATATTCARGDPRTGTLDAYNTIMALRSPLAPDTPASGAFFPRLPRFLVSSQRQHRTAGTLSFQFRPDADTDLSADLVYTQYRDLRQDNYIEAMSFGRPVTVNGQPMVSVKDVRFTPDGSLLYGLFDGVDVRSEGLTDRFTTTFMQGDVSFRKRVAPRLELSGEIGLSNSMYDNPMRLQLFMDAIDTRDFSLDFRGNSRNVPTITFGGIDVDKVSNFSYQPALVDGTVLGGFSMQGKPLLDRSDNRTATLNARWDVHDDVAIKAGYEYRQEVFLTRSYNLVPSQTAVQSGIDLSALTMEIGDLGAIARYGAPDRWVAIDPGKWAQAVDMDDFRYCGVECGAARGQVTETTHAVYLMADFHSAPDWPVSVRGNAGVRYFGTAQTALGHIPVAAPAGALYPLVGVPNTVSRHYGSLLPSANLVFDLSKDLLLRLSAGKVIARPDLYVLTPSASVNGITRNGTINNPYLDPIRASTFDASLEWYFAPDALASLGVFRKDISSYIQKVTSQIPFNQLGLPNALLDNTNSLPTDVFTIAQWTNTRGGPLSGVELNYQQNFDFLPGVWKNLGVISNYTHVTSRIRYVLTSANGAPTSTVTADLIGLSRNSASLTLFYEDSRFGLRLAGNYKGRYIRAIPASPGSDLQGNAPTTFIDASASWKLSSRVKLFIEAQNLTDEHNRQYVDSVRQDPLYDTTTGRTIRAGLSLRY